MPAPCRACATRTENRPPSLRATVCPARRGTPPSPAPRRPSSKAHVCAPLRMTFRRRPLSRSRVQGSRAARRRDRAPPARAGTAIGTGGGIFLNPAWWLASRGEDDRGDGSRQALPIRGLRLQSLAPLFRERVKFNAPPGIADQPFGGNPAFLLQLVQRRVQRAGADLQNVLRHLFQTLRKRPPVHGLQREHPQDQQTQRALHEIVRFHCCYRCPITVYP